MKILLNVISQLGQFFNEIYVYYYGKFNLARQIVCSYVYIKFTVETSHFNRIYEVYRQKRSMQIFNSQDRNLNLSRRIFLLHTSTRP